MVAPGRQFAASADEDSIHIISERYLQIDADGAVVVDEAEVGDGRQGPLDMYPAIALGPDGSIHIVTRHGGDFDAGHEIRYTRRDPNGGWASPIVVGQPVARNYAVGVAAPSGGRVLVGHGRLIADVACAIDLYAIEGNAALALGSTPQTWLRADADLRLASTANAVVLASGTPGPGGSDPTHFAFAADGDGDVLAQWQASHVGHLGGGPRRGGPSLFVDAAGNIHLGYGADGSHHYALHGSDGTAIGGDVQTMNGLGTYHLGYGNGAVVASPDGMRVAAVALANADGDSESAAAEISWSESMDAGATFGPAQPTGFVTDGGDGRMRPRLLEVGGTLVLLYRDNAQGGIVLATSAWFEDEAGTSTGDPPGANDSTGDATGSADTTGVGGSSFDSSGSDGVTSTSPGTGVLSSSGLLPGDSDVGCGCTNRGPRPAPTVALWVLLGLAFVRRSGVHECEAP